MFCTSVFIFFYFDCLLYNAKIKVQLFILVFLSFYGFLQPEQLDGRRL